jgi:hypothetical protein
MSVLIGHIPPGRGLNQNPNTVIYASRGGVELHCDPQSNLDPCDARTYAALLVRAADEVDQMRGVAQIHPTEEEKEDFRRWMHRRDVDVRIARETLCYGCMGPDVAKEIRDDRQRLQARCDGAIGQTGPEHCVICHQRRTFL